MNQEKQEKGQGALEYLLLLGAAVLLAAIVPFFPYVISLSTYGFNSLALASVVVILPFSIREIARARRRAVRPARVLPSILLSLW